MNTYALASASIPWAIGVVCMDHLYTIGLELLRGMHDTFFPLVISSLSNWLVGLPFGYFFIFSLNWGIAGFWVRKLTAFFISGSILFVRCIRK